MPRYFILSTRSISVPSKHFNVMLPLSSFLILLTIIYFVFPAFIFNLFVFIHFSTVTNAIFIFLSNSALLSPVTYTSVSSANIFMLHPSGQTLIISFIYIIIYIYREREREGERERGRERE